MQKHVSKHLPKHILGKKKVWSQLKIGNEREGVLPNPSLKKINDYIY